MDISRSAEMKRMKRASDTHGSEKTEVRGFEDWQHGERVEVGALTGTSTKREGGKQQACAPFVALAALALPDWRGRFCCVSQRRRRKRRKKDDSASKAPEKAHLSTNGHGAEHPETEEASPVLNDKDITEAEPVEETEGQPFDTAPTSAFASLDIGDEDGDAVLEDGDAALEDDDFAVADVAPKKKKKKKSKKPLELPDPPQENVLQSSEPAKDEPPVEVKRPLTAAEKKKAKKERERLAKEEKAKKEKEELDALLAELDGPRPDAGADQSVNSAPQPAQDAPAPSGKKKKKKGKGNAAAANDDVDALLAELGGAEATPKEEPMPKPEAGVDDLLAELGGAADAPAAKKKSKKKKKKGTAKADDDADGGAGEGASAASETKKPKKKESAMERLRKQEEEEARRIAEEQRLKEEEEKRKAEERAKRKAAEKAKRERKRQEGTLLSKAEKERRKKAEAFRQQMIAMGRVPAVSKTEDSEGPQRIVYSRKKKSKSKETEQPVADQDQMDVEAPTEESSHAHEGEKMEQVKDDSQPRPEPKPKPEPKPEPEPEPEPEVIPDAWDELPDVEETEKSPKSGDGAGESKSVGEREQSSKLENEAQEESDDEETDEDESDDSEYEGMTKAEIAAEKKLESIRRMRAKEKNAAMAARTRDHLRSPVICILGHVDTGKTKILDRIRRTNVQDAEAGGITQQIGATYFPIDAVKKEATKLEEGRKLDYNVPSLLIIDTPGHESFTNLRSRGSSLCDIAILVVDIMHGLEPQTRESIDLLKMRKTPFIVALNKIDRMYDWAAQPHNCPTRTTIEKQPRHVQEEFLRRVQETKLQFAEIGFNTELYWENKDVRRTVSLVPTSAITGEGMPDLLMLLLALPQKLLTDRLMFTSVLEATVLEVKVIEGLGTTIDIILTGGTIHEGDTIMVVGLDGPIVTTIRALLTPHPMKEMRVKGQYLHHKEIKAAQGIKISADGLEKAVAGTQLMVVEDPSDEQEMEYVREEVMKDFQTILTNVDRSGLGVYVQASTLGSLEALLEYLRSTKIPVSGINIGPVHKRDVTKASTMLEKQKEYATILAFDVPVEREAREMAEDVGVQIFTADIIYHLFDQFTLYMEKIKKERREAVNDDVVFPVIAKILPQHVYNKKDPIVVGVDVMEGILRVGTPLVVKHGAEWLDIGRVVSIELNKKQVPIAKKGESVAVKIQHKSTEHIMYGRHFDFQDQLVSKMSRSAIDLLKASFKEDLETEDWRLVVKLKKMFQIL
ncbi:Translation initiation factor eIF5B [Gracilaria domingensis]|nr:Translation initiation factor eIF5B [Gracilaria domingensis]